MTRSALQHELHVVSRCSRFRMSSFPQMIASALDDVAMAALMRPPPRGLRPATCVASAGRARRVWAADSRGGGWHGVLGEVLPRCCYEWREERRRR